MRALVWTAAVLAGLTALGQKTPAEDEARWQPVWVRKRSYYDGRPGRTHIQAIRSDGAIVTQTEWKYLGRRVDETRDMFFPDGVWARTSEGARLISSGKSRRDSPVPRPPINLSSEAECTSAYEERPGILAFKVMGRETMLGYEVVRLETNTQYVVETVWAAPALNCVALRTRTFSKGLGRVTETVAEEVRLGDPPAALFSIPSHYREVRPREFEVATARLIRCKSCETSGFIPMFEEWYDKSARLPVPAAQEREKKRK